MTVFTDLTVDESLILTGLLVPMLVLGVTTGFVLNLTELSLQTILLVADETGMRYL